MSRQNTIDHEFGGCEACYMESRGWGGNGCCEVCSWQHYEHICEAV